MLGRCPAPVVCPWARAVWPLTAAFPLTGRVWSRRPWARMSHSSDMCVCAVLLLAWQAVSQYMQTKDMDWEVHGHFLGHTFKCIYMYSSLDYQDQRNFKIPTNMQTKHYEWCVCVFGGWTCWKAKRNRGWSIIQLSHSTFSDLFNM